jgi:hypothetical protein
MGPLADSSSTFLGDIAMLRTTGTAALTLLLALVLGTGPAGADDASPDGKPLAQGKHSSSTIMEVTEIKRTSDGFLRISWHYRNPTNKKIEVFTEFNPLFGGTGVTMMKNLYYVDPLTKTEHKVIKNEKGRLVCSPMGAGLVVGPRETSAVYYAEFTPPSPRTRKINLYHSGMAPLDDLPLPPLVKKN